MQDHIQHKSSIDTMENQSFSIFQKICLFIEFLFVFCIFSFFRFQLNGFYITNVFVCCYWIHFIIIIIIVSFLHSTNNIQLIYNNIIINNHNHNHNTIKWWLKLRTTKLKDNSVNNIHFQMPLEEIYSIFFVWLFFMGCMIYVYLDICSSFRFNEF